MHWLSGLEVCGTQDRIRHLPGCFRGALAYLYGLENCPSEVMLAEAVKSHNQGRLHLNCDVRDPGQVHQLDTSATVLGAKLLG